MQINLLCARLMGKYTSLYLIKKKVYHYFTFTFTVAVFDAES